MASGLQCPGCGHVHPSGLPEIARGDATFRCYGCYRTLSVPEGWGGRPAPRPATPDVTLTGDAPAGAGTRDARSARLAGRGRRAAARSGSGHGDLPTQMVPTVDDDAAAGGRSATAASASMGAGAPPASPPGDGRWGAGDAGAPPAADGTAALPASTGGAAPASPPGSDRWPPAGSGGGAALRPPAGPGAGAPTVGSRSAAPGRAGSAPLGWVAPRRSGAPLPRVIRAAVWAVAFGIGLMVTAFILRKMGILDVNRVIDLYAGSGPGRFGVLLLLLPMWALLSATIAHLSLEALTKRRRPRATAPQPPVDTPAPR